MPDTNNHIGPRYSRIKIYAAHKSRGSSSYRSISDARARPQQQTRRPQLLLSIDGTDRRTERTRPFYDSRSTQPCIPPGSLNRVPASAGVRAGMLQVTLCDLMWHVSSRSGVATLRTAIGPYTCYCATDQSRKRLKSCIMQKVVTLDTCCDIACLTFQLPHITTGSFQSQR